MLKQLVDICKRKEFISIYSDSEDTSKFIFGRILCVNDDYVVIYTLSVEGRYDGIVVKQTDEIIRLERKDQYSRKMEKLRSTSGLIDTDYDIDEHDILKSVLDILKNSNRIVSFELLNSGINNVVGFLQNIQDNVCTIKQVNNYGFDDGYSYILMDDISQISFDSKEEQLVMKLWELNQL